MKKLRTLKESNSAVILECDIYKINKPILNGIECPNCKSELLDFKPNITLMTFPPQKEIKCSNKNCSYK